MKELVIFNSTENDKNTIALIEDEELVEIYEENENNKSIEGNIYIGKVQNVLNGLQSAFINIGEEKTGFIHVKDIMPKVDITKNNQVEYTEISKLIKAGDPIIVQVVRETSDQKGPRLTTHISLSSRFIVFMPNTDFITVSQKIESQTEKDRLKEIVRKYLPSGSGAIIRTVCENCSEKDLEQDIKNVLNKWEQIQKVSVNEVPKRIYDKGGVLRKTIVDLVDNNLDKIVIQDKEKYDNIRKILDEIDSTVPIEINENILLKYSLTKQLNELKNNKIWLKSGAYITIDKTEALVAIDVNSGKFIGKNNVEETVTAVNIEAAREISKQLRLRDISGIIIIDFIDMQNDEDKKAVINEIIKNCKKDRSKVQVEEFTKLNLMELTRKHINSKK